MKKDPVLQLIDDSYEVFEKKDPPVKKIMGFTYPQYVTVLMFVDAFADAAIKDSPAVAEKFQIPGRDLIENVLDYFDEIGFDVFDYANESMGLDLIDKINELWGENFSVESLIQYDKDALGTIVLIALGHNIRIDADVKRLLKDHDAKEPTAENLGFSEDNRRYKAAYEALADIQDLKTESRDDLSESFMGLFGKKSPEKEAAKTESKAEKLIQTILKQLNIKYHLEKEDGSEGIVFRHYLTINKRHYVLKSYVIKDSQHLSAVLWDEDEENLLIVMTIGYLKDYYALIAFGRQRLRAWMEEERGRHE